MSHAYESYSRVMIMMTRFGYDSQPHCDSLGWRVYGSGLGSMRGGPVQGQGARGGVQTHPACIQPFSTLTMPVHVEAECLRASEGHTQGGCFHKWRTTSPAKTIIAVSGAAAPRSLTWV